MRDAKKDLKACERATPGPWYREKTGANYKGFSTETVIADTCTFATGNKVYADLEGKGGHLPSDDADFIALARDALPYWIKRAQEAEELLWLICPTENFLETVGKAREFLGHRDKKK